MVNINWGPGLANTNLGPGLVNRLVNTNWKPGLVNTSWGPGAVNKNQETGLVNRNWGPGLVNTNWGLGLGAKARARHQAKGRGPGNKNTHKITTCNDKDPPWFNYEIRQILNKKDELFKQFVNNGKLQSDYDRQRLGLSVYPHIFFETLIVFLESTIKLITGTFNLQK